MGKDWTGNKKSTFVTLGASSHCDHERAENDFYATEPKAGELLMSLEPQLHNIWECACGDGSLSKVFNKYNKLSFSTDIVNRGYEKYSGDVDFLNNNVQYYKGSIVTNPPYKYALEFVEKALSTVADGEFVCMFLKLTFLEGKARKEFFKNNPPIRVWVSSSRLKCAMNGDFDATGSSAACYAWFVWQKGYKGKTIIDWFN